MKSPRMDPKKSDASRTSHMRRHRLLTMRIPKFQSKESIVPTTMMIAMMKKLWLLLGERLLWEMKQQQPQQHHQDVKFDPIKID